MRLVPSILFVSAIVFASLLMAASPTAVPAPSDELLKVDRALAAQSRAHGFVAAYSKRMAPEARKLDAGSQPAIGQAAISALMAQYPADLAVDWTPMEAVVAKGGDLGFTWGRYVARHRGASGKVVVEHGKYLDVWKRQPDGSWKWIADIGNANAEPPPDGGAPAR